MKLWNLLTLDVEAYVQMVVLGLVAATLVIMGTILIYVSGIGSLLASLLTVYIAVPFVINFSSTIQRHIIFMHRLYWRWGGSDYFNPSRHGIKGGRNLYLDDSSGIRLGVWHILPEDLLSVYADKAQEEWDNALAEGNPIIVYFHGNMGSRASGHRMELYKILQRLNYHVVSFDYSGFSDSRGARGEIVPSKSSTLAEGMLMYDWVVNLARQRAPILFWGHSLGSGVSSLVLATLTAEANAAHLAVSGLILEAPFTSLRDVILSHPVSSLYSFWPQFEWLFTSKLAIHDFDYESDNCLPEVRIPIQILHAINDPIIPYRICKKLINGLKKAYEEQEREQSRSFDRNVRLEKFDEFSASFAHAFICRSQKLPAVISNFVESCVSNKHNT